jgi:hypothetical protein
MEIFLDVFMIILSIVFAIGIFWCIRSIIKDYQNKKEQQKRVERYAEYLRQGKLNQIKIGCIYIEDSKKPLWDKEIWQVADIHKSKYGYREIHLKDCLSEFKDRVVSENELIDSYICDNHIFDYDFMYGNRLLESYTNIIESFSEKKAIIEEMVNKSRLNKENKFRGSRAEDISDEDYYEYIDYLVCQGKQIKGKD